MPSSSPDSAAFPESLVRPEPLDLHFEGFSAEAFAVLERMREHPYVAQYRIEKPALDQFVMAPFERYRDDLVLNWVLPNALPFETEKNVFSRLLKNDFGAGGSHHHLWMSFYRHGSRRLHDLQLAHTIRPDAFSVSLYVGDYAQQLVRAIRERVLESPSFFVETLRALLTGEGWQASVYAGAERVPVSADVDFAALAPFVARAKGFWVRRSFPRADVLAWGPELVGRALDAVDRLWPLYLYYLETGG